MTKEQILAARSLTVSDMTTVTFLDSRKTYGQFTIGEFSTSFWSSKGGYKYVFGNLDFCDIQLACKLIDDAK